MPKYTTQCEECASTDTVRLSFEGYDAVLAGTKRLSCTSCSGALDLKFDPGEVNFIMSDGESGGWTSKAGKENAYRRRRNEEMKQRERDHVFKSRLQPNYQGQETETWVEAQALAREKTFEKVNQEQSDVGLAKQAANKSAETFQPLVNREVAG